MDKHIATFVMGLGLSITAFAYDKGGHFFSADDMVVHAMPPDQGGAAEVIAFCTQLPDESQEIDATEAAFAALKSAKLGYLNWGVRDEWQGNAEIQRMILVQRTQHVLLGTQNVPQVQAATLASFKDLLAKAHAAIGTPDENNALCAAGLALHAYGDSFAHVDMDYGDRMYVTGRGHAKHVHYPDYPLCEVFKGAIALFYHCETATSEQSPRFAGWQRYFQSVQSAIAEIFSGQGPPRSVTKGEFIEALWHADCASDYDLWCESEIQKSAINDIGGPEQAKTLVDMDVALAKHKPSPCREALEIAWPTSGGAILKGSKPSCTEAFNRYLAAARDRIQALTNDNIPLDKLPLPDFGESAASGAPLASSR